ncbi:ABC transporter ATP-binding protein [Tabrizicola sp. J26]|uniref:ABC transporter ATP-binding protein n=1 Tax=Alitabrizicola rongguiensis TaxID=2909234 RepID=UPI001F3CCFFA|nr:ABC transporter ATP-binding protein [Tabrizicola rongguiensis]MCF1707891.1 ABC transporter ATP-binding protein [Tabrizicola rongguiensis]
MPSTPMTADALLSVRDLRVTFRLPQAEIRAVDGVSFDLNRGEVLGIVGESGSGKSQILFALMGLLAGNGRTAGEAMFGGRNLLALSPRELDRVRGSEMSIVFQDPMTALNPYKRVGDQLAEGLIVHRGLSRDAAWKEAVAMLDRVRIPDPVARAKAYPHQFSGGMRQRVMIAMALLMKPAILLADEPTTALDVTIQAQVLDLIAELARETGTAVILVTHDLGVVARACDRVLVLYGGQVMEEAAIDTLFDRPRHPYTQGLLEAMPRLEGEETARLGTIPGTPSARRGPGCPFAPRCDRSIAICSQEAPMLLTNGSHRIACHVEGADAAA